MNKTSDNAFAGARRVARAVVFGFMAFPLVWAVLLYSFILHWHSFHGAWPDTTGPKPATIAIQLAPHEDLTAVVTYFLIYSFPVWLLFLTFLYRYVIHSPRRRMVLVPWAVVFTLVVADPGRFISWFFD